MKPKAARPIQSLQWIPAERLGGFRVDPGLRAWLIAKGVLSARLREVCRESFALRLLHQWSGILTASQRLGLKSEDNAGLIREVALRHGDRTWVFAQSVMPDSPLCRHPWLAELDETPLDQILEDLFGVERGAYEYAWLDVEPASASAGPGAAAHAGAAAHSGAAAPARGIDALAERALEGTGVKPAGLWARRARIVLHGAPLLIQEVFLPVVGRDPLPDPR